MQKQQFGSYIEAIIYPFLLVSVMWLVYWADHLFPIIPFYKYGIMPREILSLKGVLFMPIIHSYNDCLLYTSDAADE